MMIPSRIEQSYFKDIGKFTVLKDGEEKKLIKDLRGKDQALSILAMQRLITGNMRFVVKVAQKYQNRGLALLDLVNEGNIGLYKAAQHFNLDKEIKFISYAVWWIRQSIQKSIDDKAGLVKIPPNKLSLLFKFRRELQKNDGNFDKTMQIPEFKEREKDIVEIMEKSVPLSFDAPLKSTADGDGPGNLYDIIGVDASQDEKIDSNEIHDIIISLLDEMTPREKEIVLLYYGIEYEKEYTLEEIGNKLSLTRERVRQIKNKALRKLFKNQALRNYVKENEISE